MEKSREDGKTKLSQRAHDIEAHTGEKSAERIGQEIAAPIIRDAQTWDELHHKLAEQGIAFEKKGSGGVLHIGETVIKASQAGRDISLSKLEKRLGEYLERDERVAIEAVNATPKPEAVERVNKMPTVKNSWERYQEAKITYFAEKKTAFSRLKERHGDERKLLLDSQREERSSLFFTSWKGRGAELNQLRSVMAAKQQGEKLDLRDRQKKERDVLKNQFPYQLPSFKKWLSLDGDRESLPLLRYPEQLVISPSGNNENFSLTRTFDLRDYSPRLGKAPSRVLYCKNDSNIADFIDYGKRIVLAKNFNEASVLAALQLASQKWNGIQINGSQEYKNLCVRLAVEHGFKIANPELKAEIEAIHKRREEREKFDPANRSKGRDTGASR